MRVAYVIHDLRYGGTERRMLAVLAGLDRARFDPLVVCIDGLGELAGEAGALGVEPIVLGRAFRLDLRGILRLARLLRRERVAVVHGWLPFANLFARVAGTLARVPVRLAAEGLMGPVNTADARRARGYELLDRVLLRFTDGYTVNSEGVASTLRARGVPSGKIAVIPNGVAVPEPLREDERARLRAELGAMPGAPLIGMVARLDTSQKDQPTFLAAAAELIGDGRPLRVVLVGEGDSRSLLERRAVQLGISEHVVFTGYRSDASRLIGAFDVSVMLSRAEGLSNVVLESMAAGAPLVATAIPPNEEAVDDGDNGLLVQVGDVGETAAALRRLLDDGALAARLGDAARRRAIESFSLDAQAASTMRLYEDLLERKGVRL